MRQFQFTLKLRDGRIVTARAVAERWEWSKAFAEACARVEAQLGLDSWSGIVCVDYDSNPVPPIMAIAQKPQPGPLGRAA